jgi:hypothetical protein
MRGAPLLGTNSSSSCAWGSARKIVCSQEQLENAAEDCILPLGVLLCFLLALVLVCLRSQEQLENAEKNKSKVVGRCKEDVKLDLQNAGVVCLFLHSNSLHLRKLIAARGTALLQGSQD